MAAKLFVVDLNVAPHAAPLTSPPIATQHPLSQLFIRVGFQPQANRFRLNPVHDAFSVICWTNACRCSPGRNLKNLETECKSTSGFPLSRFAPARKSAQIISRQYPRDLSLPSINAAVSIACSITGIWLLYSLK